MEKYKKGKIYRIINNDGDIYIGSTIQSLKRRLNCHKSKYKRYIKGYQKYITSFEILKSKSYKIELIENYPCKSKKMLLKKEAYWIRKLNCVNHNIPARTKKEYYIDNKTALRRYQSIYNFQNKKKIKQYNKNYYLINNEYLKHKICCNCGSIVSHYNFWQHKKTIKHNEYINNPFAIFPKLN